MNSPAMADCQSLCLHETAPQPPESPEQIIAGHAFIAAIVLAMIVDGVCTFLKKSRQSDRDAKAKSS